jgi:hypothetical protein
MIIVQKRTIPIEIIDLAFILKNIKVKVLEEKCFNELFSLIFYF